MIRGIFHFRKNKRVAEVEVDGYIEEAYISNGAELNFMQENAECLLREADNPARQTAYDLYAVADGDTMVCVDTKAPLELAEQWCEENMKGTSDDQKQKFTSEFRSMILYGRDTTVWVMSTSLKQGNAAYLPEQRSGTLCKRIESVLDGHARGLDARLLILACRNDVEYFTPNKEADPYFYNLLKRIQDEGISAECLACTVNEDGIAVDRLIPIKLMEQLP